jgi:competence protein ComEC
MSLPDDPYIHRIPFVRLLLPFLAGIITGLSPVSFSGYILFPVSLAGLLLVLYAFALRKPALRYRRELWGGAGIVLLYFAAGLLAGSVVVHDQAGKTKRTGPSVVAGVILRPAAARQRSEKVMIRVEAVRQQGEWSAVPGKAVLYFRKGSEIARCRPGEVVLVRTTLRSFPYYGNPGGFDYRRYMNGRGFLWQGYVKEGAWCRLPGHERRSPLFLAGRLQGEAVALLRGHGLTGQRLAVAAALLAGEREYLDRETRSLFSASGTMHILAISGLHVGILYLVLVWLFPLAGNSRTVKYISFPVILLALWGYAFITGLSPSVTRAALMFSLFLTASLFRRKSNPYNTLAVAAFLMLLASPLLVQEASFQLSFLAVLGIVTFYRPLYHLLATGWWVADRVWALVALSLSAQLTTFPLTLFYFHRFPLLFPVTNLLVIPLVTLFIYGGLLFFLLHAVPFAAGPLSVFLGKTAGLLLQITARAGTLPHAVVEPVWLPPAGVVWCYLMVLGITVWFVYRKPRLLILLQLLLLTGLTGLLVREWKRNDTDRLVVFNIPGETAILLSSGKTGVLLREEEKATGYYTDNAPGYYGLKRVVTVSGEKKQPDKRISLPPGIQLRKGFFRAGGISGFWLKEQVRPLKKKLPVDCLLFSGRKWWLVQRQLESLSPEVIVLDGSVSSYTSRRIRESCPGQHFYEVRRAGPFILERREKIIRKSFPMHCKFFTFAPYLLQTDRPSRKKP